MIKIDGLWFSVFADLAINLAAAFYALIIVAPAFSSLEIPFRFFFLTMDLFTGTLFLVLARWLREQVKKYA